MNISGNDMLKEPRNLSFSKIRVRWYQLMTFCRWHLPRTPASPPCTNGFNTSCHGRELTWIYGGRLRSRIVSCMACAIRRLLCCDGYFTSACSSASTTSACDTIPLCVSPLFWVHLLSSVVARRRTRKRAIDNIDAPLQPLMTS